MSHCLSDSTDSSWGLDNEGKMGRSASCIHAVHYFVCVYFQGSQFSFDDDSYINKKLPKELVLR